MCKCCHETIDDIKYSDGWITLDPCGNITITNCGRHYIHTFNNPLFFCSIYCLNTFIYRIADGEDVINGVPIVDDEMPTSQE